MLTETVAAWRVSLYGPELLNEPWSLLYPGSVEPSTSILCRTLLFQVIVLQILMVSLLTGY